MRGGGPGEQNRGNVRAAARLLSLILLVACTPAEDPSTQTPASGAATCIDVDRPLEGTIENSLKGPRTLGSAVAVEASDLGPLGGPQSEPRAWFVAAEIEGEGIGLWITNEAPDSSGGGLIFGVNDVAREFSILGVDVPLQASEGHPRAQKAISCAGG